MEYQRRSSSSSIVRPATTASFLLTRERKPTSQFVHMAISLPRATFGRMSSGNSAPIVRRRMAETTSFRLKNGNGRRRSWRGVAGSRSDDSAPFEMSIENALKLLGVSEVASFDEILRAKKAIVAACKDDQAAIAQVEAAYDMLLMQSLTQRRAGKVVSSGIRYADVKPVKPVGVSTMPQWLQTSMKSAPVSVDSPSTGDLGIQAGVYGALMVLTYANGTATSVGSYSGADVPGLILATSFGASLYFMTKKNVKLGKATLITVGGLVAGAVVGSVVENWLQVDIVPFLGLHSPAAVVSEFILVSQLLVLLYLR